MPVGIHTVTVLHGTIAADRAVLYAVLAMTVTRQATWSSADALSSRRDRHRLLRHPHHDPVARATTPIHEPEVNLR